ncbi:S1C family serine protease [Paenibacillus monticola]|uniref:Trypsin-like serine protease n=1 Tax=Paenibacillus monticola TaxID=2666075 RepID=A0A7X2L2M6_9BACL|nr:trypsin-like peptidase domain-containing protein [Paenibacillus monticola]MRN54355.1 trypsin-like serine protease [Paenibacillus monticola]
MRKTGLSLLLCGMLLTVGWGGNASAFGSVATNGLQLSEGISGKAIKELGVAASVSKLKNLVSSEDLVPQIIEAAAPSVVGIIGKSSGEHSSGPDDRYNLTHGSGIIIKSNGWIITNAHVIKDLQNVVVVTSDAKKYSITESYADEYSDLALIKINAKSLKPAKFASAAVDPLVGEKVIAIGTPISFSLRNSATVGVISGLDRKVDAAYRLIQSDTAINPGNSGGPLLNMKGEVLGINSLKYSAVGVENMGFAIPTETVQYIMNQLFKYGEVKRPSLGMELEESWSAIVGIPTGDPLTVTKVDTASARKSGITEGDVLYSIDGHRVTSLIDINELFKSYVPGATVRLLMQSDGDIIVRKLVLGQGDPLMSVEDSGADGDEQPEE